MTEQLEQGDAARLSLSLPGQAEQCEILMARGLLGRLPELLDELAPAPHYAVVSDSTVAPLYGQRVADAIGAAGRRARVATFKAGEASKSPDSWVRLVEWLGSKGFGRDGCVVAVGGGVTGDLAGFVAATYARGIRLVQVPTSLLAMIDASLGGKTGIDLRAGKNLAGAFHQPRLVAVDPDVLATLPDAQLREGLAEAVKHGAVADAAYLSEITVRAQAIMERQPDALDPLILGSIRIKTSIVARDALEGGERAVLNFGHTVAHAIELLTDYRVPHGEAVAIGMVAEARIGEQLGVTHAGTADRLRETLSRLGLPTEPPPDVDPSAVVDATRTDKKARAGRVRYSLIERLGTPARGQDGGWTVEVEDTVVEAAVASS